MKYISVKGKGREGSTFMIALGILEYTYPICGPTFVLDVR